MPIPGTTIEWDDQSDIPALTTPEEDLVDRPIYMVAFTADKGPEEWKHRVRGQRFFQLYGNPSFKRHGQASIQAAKVIQQGGIVTAKRVVASDSLLANLVLVAKVEKVQEQETDANDIYLWQYNDPDTGAIVQVSSSTLPVAGTGGIPAGVTITPVLVDGTVVTYRLQSFSALGNKMDTFAKAARLDYDNGGKPALGTSGEYPLMLIADTGRGVSNKRFRIIQDDNMTYPLYYHRYFLEVYENDEILEQIAFTLNPYIIESNRNMSIETAVLRDSNQVRCRFFEDIYDDFIENIEYISGAANFNLMDPLFGYDLNGEAIKHYSTNASPILDSIYGNPLVGGSNGSFGDYPASIENTTQIMNIVDIALKAAYSGNTEDGDDIYDMDNNRIDVIFDANYHQEVKRAIEQLVNFREDCVYFRDFGLNCNTITDMKIIDSYQSHSRFCCSYMNWYKIYDPYSRKQIKVTVTYDLAILFVNHFINGRIRPFCGQKYGIVIPQQDFVEGSLNFRPTRTPREDQRKIFDDLRINYLAYYDGNVLTMNTEYTSQKRYTQLSWVNNVLGIQEMIKAIRVLCPKIRYSFLDGEDLQNYKNDVQNLVISRYANRFKSCTIEYASNAVYDSNKLIYAVIKVQFRNFVQTEVFKIIALQS